MNAYGFAGGDRINFSDPMGLTPCCVELGNVLAAVSQGAQKNEEALRQEVTGLVVGAVLPGAGARREFFGGTASAGEALTAGERWLGEGYREIGGSGSGVFRSADNARQFRMTLNDLVGDAKKGMHVHFEKIAKDGKEILESTWLRIKK